ncbi:replication-associated recombination protein A [Colwellia sp. 1_MG-2023]|uniref:replication-associated recombination protein A n=1 Tax=unclassified Colwellia TaxID=196834 RepID=UPI001C0A4A87|nr:MULTISPECIES: replication-associated recombination protein A [unclassified Colwellia]MBU2926076.1 replication-associated recombination protein A [Colwellia sp. C2M11]MDO6653217.1 replication-associated recombination protein A [Colwellia sp. 3_MG-2023]MDO6666030.1 replication-associated recombination protein A [Colwellia sp. 2_MG-2023]MDO6690484.1 replication-associated recombination protein A [Colwellia sp. 1_MG-2023]
MRPKSLEDYVGQQHILGEESPLKQAIIQGHCHSLIFWGPPGSGKTTLAEIIATHANAKVVRLSAVTSGIKDIRLAIEQAKIRANNSTPESKTVLFVDEVHRFNKSQQDAFLPFIEDGTIIFIGATTENPAFELNQAILSRARVYTLKKLNADELSQVLTRAISLVSQEQGVSIIIDQDAKQSLLNRSDGDARRLLNLLENCLDSQTAFLSGKEHQITISVELIAQVAGSKIALYDKGGDAFYDLISAFHKSVRGSDPNAALYWYARILTGGGDALYVARRLLAIASEDIGNADPRAMQLAINAWDTFHRVGPSEGERAIAQAAVYMALAPKSNAVYMAFNQAKVLAEQTSSLDVPDHLKNSTSEITKNLGHGVDYRYAHNEINAFAAGENYFPEALAKANEQASGYNTDLYQPSDRGLEKQLKEKLDYLNQLNQNSSEQRYE